MFGRLSAVKNASQSVICRGYFETTCLNASIFFPNRPISETLIFLPGPFLNIFIHSEILKITRLARH